MIMKFYQEITLINNDNKVWSKLYQNVHIGLADLKNKQGKSVGVSFPQYHVEANDEGVLYGILGDKLRIFAHDKDTLQQLDINNRLKPLQDDIHVSSIKPVPKGIKQFLVVSRYRHKTLEQKAYGFAVLKRVGYEEALAHVTKHQSHPQKLPFITLKSSSNSCFYPLIIKQVTVPSSQATQVDDQLSQFNTFGMNSNNHQYAVPHW